MKNNEFDKKVKEMFDEFKETYDPTSWDSFEKKLDTEQEVDDLVKSSLESHKEPFNEEHWDMLVAEISRRRQRTIIKRSAEVIIVLLLIFTTHNFLQFKGEKTRDQISIAQLGYDFDLETVAAVKDIPLVQITKTIKVYNTEASEEVLLSRTDVAINDGLNIQLNTTSSSVSDPISKSLIGSNEHSAKGLVTNNEYGSVTGIGEEHQPLAVTKSHSALSLIPSMDIAQLSGEELSIELVTTPELIQEDDGKGVWIGIIGGPDVNFVNSQFDLNLLKNPVRSQSGAISYGITVSKDFGLVEMSSGLIYSSKNYYPRAIQEFVPALDKKYLETSLIGVEFDQYQIPLLFNIHTTRIGGWSMFGTLGVGINMITKTQYDVETQVRSLSYAPSVSNGLEIDLLQLERGALQGGSFDSNVYMSGIAGIGIEKRFKNKFAITATTTYQHSLSTNINPIINRTQQLGITLGAKMNLNK